jgi:hypothetical protein
MATERTVVIFRKWLWGGRELLALFPCVSDGNGRVLSYEHVGQHGGADYAGCMGRTRAATAEEYAPLKLELEGRGYVLDIRQRRPGRQSSK